MPIAVSNFEYAQAYTASGDIPAGRFVALAAGSDQHRKDDSGAALPEIKVKLPGDAADKLNIIGVAHLGGQDGKHTPVVCFAGQRVQVAFGGTEDAISAGDIVKSDDDGRAVKIATGDDRRLWLGIVMGPERAAKGSDSTADYNKRKHALTSIVLL